MRNKIIGILGGMGPESTVDLFQKMIKATPIKKEQDHLRIIIDNNPQIPDRTEAILGLGESPLNELIKTAQNLEKAGAEIIAIPCNTAHHYYKEVKDSVNVQVLNMIEETVKFIKKENPLIKKIALLSTTGTLKAKVYHKMLSDFEVLIPDDEAQERLMEAIYGKEGIKAGYVDEKSQKKVLAVAKPLLDQGAEALIAGCTEISLVLRQEDLPISFIEPLAVLAQAAVKQALVSQ